MYQEVILIRMNEIFLKGNNRSLFTKLLRKNIKSTLFDIDFELMQSANRLYIENFNKDNLVEIVSRLKHVFGIHSFSIARKFATNFDFILQNALDISKNEGSFKVDVKRADKTLEKNSMQIEREVGEYILNKKRNLHVNLSSPSSVIYIDIRENGITYCFSDKIDGPGGLPVSSAGTGLLLLSGGIDSPVAGYQMAKRGIKLSAIHFHSAPYTSELAKQKVIDLAKILSQYNGDLDLYIVPFTNIQLEIHSKCAPDLTITIMRRFMVRIAEKLANSLQISSIITGESLGQVASQTLESLTSTQSAINDILVFRPLISFDKADIINISRDISTYETSILAYEDCCTIFLPKKPAIKPSISFVTKQEEKITNSQSLIDEAIANIEKIVIKRHF